MPFKLSKANFEAFRKMNMSERVATTHDQMGVWLLSLMTPTQIAELFPRYYRDVLPNISGFTKAMPTSMSIAKQQAIEEQLNNTASGSAAGANFNAGGWKKKWQDGMGRSIATHRNITPPPQLSPEQKANWDALKSGAIAADDPRMNMFKGLDEARLNSIGVTRYTENGKTMLKYSAPTFGDEEVTNYIKNNGDKIERILATIRERESGGKYGITRSGASASGAYQFIDSTWSRLTRKFGIGTEYDRAYQAPPNVQDAVARAYVKDILNRAGGDVSKIPLEWYTGNLQGQMTAAQLAANNGLTAEAYQSKWLRDYGRRGGDSITADYSEKGKQLARERMISEAETRRVGDLAKWTTSESMVATDSPTVSGKGAKVAGHLGDGVECVDLSKHYSNLGPASKWEVGGTDGIVPGAIIATENYGHGDTPGGKRASSFADGKSRYHTGVALTRPDANGDVLVLDQYASRGASISKVNIYNYNGTGIKMGVVKGGEPSEKSMRAVEFARSLATTEQLGAMSNQTMTAMAVKSTPDKVQKETPRPNETRPQDLTDYTKTKEIKPTASPEVVGKAEAKPVADTTKQTTQSQPASQPTAQVAPASSGNKFRFDKEAYLEEVGKKTMAYAPIVGPGREYVWRETLKGLREAQDAGVLKFDEKSGSLNIKDMNDPKVQSILADMKKHGLDKDVFLKREEEKKKAEVTKTPEAPKVDKKPEVAAKNEPPKVDKKPEGAKNEPPKVDAKPKENAPTQVKSNSLGGTNRVNTEQISAYPINGIKNDNVVVVNKQQKPLFTMNTNEGMVMDPSTKTASVLPVQRPSPLRPNNPVNQMMQDFNSGLDKLKEAFVTNDPGKAPEQPQINNDHFLADSYSGVALDQLNTNSANWYLSPSVQRASYRVGGMETGEPNNNFHYSHNNRS